MSEESASSAADGTGIDADEQRQVVRERYGDIASTSSSSSCCGGSDETAETDDSPSSSSCCGDDGEETDLEKLSRQLGYSEAELEQVLGDANLGLGCGNPTAIASLESGETVLDLGAGGGFDCFLAADAVGPEGQVIGVDMTPEMVETARENARANDAANVEFRLGEIEALPVADETVEVIISNCVVNLSPDKPRVFREAFRVLRPGGRLAITDVVLTAELPVDIQGDPDSVASCVAGASWIEDLEAMMAEAGFEGIEIEPKEDSEEFIEDWDAERNLSEFLVSARIEGKKPV